MTAPIASKPFHGDVIGEVREGQVFASPALQSYLDDLEAFVNQFRFTVATVPDAGAWEGLEVYVSDETGGAVRAFSDGTNWRRCTDRAVIS